MDLEHIFHRNMDRLAGATERRNEIEEEKRVELKRIRLCLETIAKEMEDPSWAKEIKL